mmetsp:Transcript_15284/g.35794  ORF Transcript_15284/g.35794 Transcript_15284/m.35794 type:complete len:209 (-) Transcript_15284:119-745(-)
MRPLQLATQYQQSCRKAPQKLRRGADWQRPWVLMSTAQKWSMECKIREPLERLHPHRQLNLNIIKLQKSQQPITRQQAHRRPLQAKPLLSGVKSVDCPSPRLQLRCQRQQCHSSRNGRKRRPKIPTTGEISNSNLCRKMIKAPVHSSTTWLSGCHTILTQGQFVVRENSQRRKQRKQQHRKQSRSSQSSVTHIVGRDLRKQILGPLSR